MVHKNQKIYPFPEGRFLIFWAPFRVWDEPKNQIIVNLKCSSI